MDHSPHDLFLERVETPGVRQPAVTVMAPHRDPHWVPSPLVDWQMEFAEFVPRLKARDDAAR